MAPRFSLAHLTVLGCTPAETIHIAAETGYDMVSLRIIPMDLPGEGRYPLADDKAMLRETKAALAATGLKLLDIEVARISDDRDVRNYRGALETGAELGAKHVITSGFGQDHARIADQFSQLCALAQPLGLTVDLEFLPFADVATLADAHAMVKASGFANAGILIDTLHFDRARTTLAEVGAIPPGLFHFAQLCDAANAVAPTREDMIRTARGERLYLGEGVIPVRDIMAHLPDMPCALEIAHLERQRELGYKEFARQCLVHARRYFGA